MSDPYSPNWPWDPDEWAAIQEAAAIRAKIERSSLGTPEAKALRATVSDEHAARIVARSKELAEVRCVCGHDEGDHSPKRACRVCFTRCPLPPGAES